VTPACSPTERAGNSWSAWQLAAPQAQEGKESVNWGPAVTGTLLEGRDMASPGHLTCHPLSAICSFSLAAWERKSFRDLQT